MLRLTVLTASVRSINNNAQQLLLFLSLLYKLSISRLTSSIHSLLRTNRLPTFHRGKPYHGSWQTRIKKHIKSQWPRMRKVALRPVAQSRIYGRLGYPRSYVVKLYPGKSGPNLHQKMDPGWEVFPQLYL